MVCQKFNYPPVFKSAPLKVFEINDIPVLVSKSENGAIQHLRVKDNLDGIR